MATNVSVCIQHIHTSLSLFSLALDYPPSSRLPINNVKYQFRNSNTVTGVVPLLPLIDKPCTILLDLDPTIKTVMKMRLCYNTDTIIATKGLPCLIGQWSRLINVHFPDLKLSAKTKGYALLDKSMVTVNYCTFS